MVNLTGSIIFCLIILFIVVVVSLLIREIVCWYWKINLSLTTLNEIRDELRKIRVEIEKSNENKTGSFN